MSIRVFKAEAGDDNDVFVITLRDDTKGIFASFGLAGEALKSLACVDLGKALARELDAALKLLDEAEPVN